MSDAARHMDAIYRTQRHFYDVTRKPYLLGRDRLIDDLDVPAGGRVLEIGCGTARNLIRIADRYPRALCHGIDVSEAMLETARRSIESRGLAPRVHVAWADAMHFDPAMLFGVPSFDRVVISYTLSMVPEWRSLLRAALSLLEPDGSLHVVDFGDQSTMPNWFSRMLHAWLRRFSVEPRNDLPHYLADLATAQDRPARHARLYGSYAVLLEVGARRIPPEIGQNR